MALTTLAFPGADTVDARVELEQRRRPRVDKCMSAAEAVRQFVADGDTIAVGGTNHARTPMALLAEVLRQGRRGLSLARPLTCFESELFIATGMASKVITSWVGIGHGWAWPGHRPRDGGGLSSGDRMRQRWPVARRG